MFIRQILHRKFIVSDLSKQFSTKIKPVVQLNEEVSKNIDDEVYKPRNHPGRLQHSSVSVPDKLIKSIEITCEDYSIKTLMKQAIPFGNYLFSRHPPVEQSELREIKKEVMDQVMERTKNVQMKDEHSFQQSLTAKVNKKLKQNVYNWTPINYNLYNSMLYLFARLPADYAALVKIFGEINSRHPDFKPRGFFDFGSGVGSATWAANLFWKDYFFEYFNVDASKDMNDLALLLLKGGKGFAPDLPSTFYRQFLPATNLSYELVVSAFALLELPSSRSRLQTIINLWNKTSDYLVLVEHGTNAGFKVINEARDFILNIQDEENQGHVFSPCPHDSLCPRFVQDSTPCNFLVNYYSLPLSGNVSINKSLYSYVVLKKGKRAENDSQWPRLVRPPIVRSKHSVCRMCTSEGKLQEVIFTNRAHGKKTFYCARMSAWGDRLPIKIENVEVSEDPTLNESLSTNVEEIQSEGSNEKMEENQESSHKIEK